MNVKACGYMSKSNPREDFRTFEEELTIEKTSEYEYIVRAGV